MGHSSCSAVATNFRATNFSAAVVLQSSSGYDSDHSFLKKTLTGVAKQAKDASESVKFVYRSQKSSRKKSLIIPK